MLTVVSDDAGCCYVLTNKGFLSVCKSFRAQLLMLL